MISSLNNKSVYWINTQVHWICSLDNQRRLDYLTSIKTLVQCISSPFLQQTCISVNQFKLWNSLEPAQMNTCTIRHFSVCTSIYKSYKVPDKVEMSQLHQFTADRVTQQHESLLYQIRNTFFRSKFNCKRLLLKFQDHLVKPFV